MLKKVGIALSLVVATLLGYAVYAQATKSCRSTKLACHKEVVVFERVYHPENVVNLQKALLLEGLHVNLHTQKSHYSPSKLFNVLDVTWVQSTLYETFDKAKSQEAPRLDLLIYENDPLDPGKKTQEAKLYAGYLVFGFYLGETLVYKVQIDFMDKEGRDVAQRIACAKESLMAL